MTAGATEEEIQKIGEALFEGRKVAAVKIYREATGVELREAKEFVWSLEAALREKSPERFQAPARRGCAGIILIAIIMASAVAGFAL